MANTIHLNRVLELLDDPCFAEDVLEYLRLKLSRNDLIVHELKGGSVGTGSGGYYVTLVYPIPLLPSGPGGVFRLQLHSPPKPVRLSGSPLKTERVGFEPTVELPPHTLSKRAP